jgi:hypothetical protein
LAKQAEQFERNLSAAAASLLPGWREPVREGVAFVFLLIALLELLATRAL